MHFLLERPIQLSVPGLCGDFVCLSAFAQRFNLDLSTTKFSVRRAQDTNLLSVIFSGGGLPKPSRVHQSWIGSCWIRSGKGLWQLCQGLDEALLLSLLLLHLLQRLMQLLILSPQRNGLFWIHFPVRGLSRSLLCLLIQALSSRPELVPTIRLLP